VSDQEQTAPPIDLSITQISEALTALLKALPDSPDYFRTLDGADSARKRLRKLIRLAVSKLVIIAESLDPIQLPRYILDPTNPKVVGQLIGDTLLKQEREPLRGLRQFYGSGVYALYYSGDFPVYSPISGTDTPIYVGKADPANHEAETAEEQGEAISKRLDKHVRNIRKVNLSLDHFECRYLVVRTAWQRTAEQYLIDLFHPVWNDNPGPPP